MEWFLVFGSVVCTWAFLRALGSEREHRLIRAKTAAEESPAAANPAQPRKS